MTRTAARLAELDRISRERSLTDEEQRAVMYLARMERRNGRRRALYHVDEAFRQTRINRDWKRNLRAKEAST